MSADYAMLCCLAREKGFRIGSRVKVINQSHYKYFHLNGEEGTVRLLGSKLSVVLDNFRNPNSSYGAFYFNASELVILNQDKKENTMQNNTITNYLNIAKIKFIDSPYNNPNTYLYANFDPELKSGDVCVVKTVNHGFGIAKVEEILDQNDIATSR